MSDRPTDPADEPPDPGAPDEPRDSVLGSLPRTRPSVRSPRRDAAAQARQSRAAAEDPAPSEPPSGPAAEGEGTGLGDVARAGVTTAAQVATAGLRFAGRAAGAIRDFGASR